MVGNYPLDPATVGLSVFHSIVAPKGSGMNYSNGITPFVLAKGKSHNGHDVYIMKTGFRERQGTSSIIQQTCASNRGRSSIYRNHRGR